MNWLLFVLSILNIINSTAAFKDKRYGLGSAALVLAIVCLISFFLGGK
ncbi:hypothetical protein [Heyndrickxia camelliae]|nr:hypothetical protein [Heyndrickxia camelliae]